MSRSRPNRTAARAPVVCSIALLLAACAADALPGQNVQRSRHHNYRVVTVAEGLDHPWGMAFLPGGDILVTEKGGKLRVIRNGRLLDQSIAGVPAVVARGQGGLMDVLVHPNFASNRFVYLSFSKPGERGVTTGVVRGRLEGDRLADVRDIFVANAWSNAGQHFGSRMAFDRQGLLYITVGERGDMRKAQDLRNHNGTTIRLHDDGRVPQDNPFVGRNDALPEIYTYGNRNAQGLAMHPTTGEMWLVEHGPRGGDEVNVVKPGANYGWPVVTYGIDYGGRPISDITEKEGMEQPLHYWRPSIATSGMTFYTGDRFPNWRGDLFVGGLVGQHIARLRFDGTRVTEQEKLLEGRGRVRDVRTGPDGFIYVLLDEPNSPLLRLEPT